ncbi:MAG: YdcF family protein [Anaerocolumna sp.]
MNLIAVSGGQGEDISEAKAMEEYLISKGINAQRILKEDQSTNTHQNLLFSKTLMEKGNPSTVIVTSRFHVFRAMGIAGKLGITKAEGLGAPTDDIMTLSYYVREFFAVVKDKLVGNI